MTTITKWLLIIVGVVLIIVLVLTMYSIYELTQTVKSLPNYTQTNYITTNIIIQKETQKLEKYTIEISNYYIRISNVHEKLLKLRKQLEEISNSIYMTNLYKY